jgi:hypothetical protein
MLNLALAAATRDRLTFEVTAEQPVTDAVVFAAMHLCREAIDDARSIVMDFDADGSPLGTDIPSAAFTVRAYQRCGR